LLRTDDNNKGSAVPGPPKPVLLLVLDGIRPDVLRSAMEAGEAPNLGAIATRGQVLWDATSVFPSITPAATAAIATGEPPAGSGIPGHVWYDREERRLVVYGATRETVLATGPVKVFHNNVWRMNRDDLLAPTVFESLHDGGLDSAVVNFPVRRGPHEHPVRMRSVREYANRSELLGGSVSGPKEYFMGDLFYSRETGLNGRGALGGVGRAAGINDEYAARVGSMLLEDAAAPLTLVYFFKGDSLAHHEGLEAQRRYVATMDGYVGLIFEPWGGAEGFLDEHAVLALSDHGHAPLWPNKKHRGVNLRNLFHEGRPGGRQSSGPRARMRRGVASMDVPNGRAAFVYLVDGQGGGAAREEAVSRASAHPGVDLAAWMEGGWGAVRGRGGQELRFRPSENGGARDGFGRAWELDGEPGALDLHAENGTVSEGGRYPDALERLWGCLRSERSGDVVLSAGLGYTFGEVSGKFHDASDHGSLHAADSKVFVLASGLGAGVPRRITGVAPALLAHFGVTGTAEQPPIAAGHRGS